MTTWPQLHTLLQSPPMTQIGMRAQLMTPQTSVDMLIYHIDPETEEMQVA